ncbi:MAG: ArsR family transcriptional regulator [Rhodobacteraceae bacterium]|nr:ArsR family transcriptional regulator [Paracoccaceae bacterium]
MIAVLLAALIGPFFIDWTAYRSTFEDYGERLLGHRVAVMGDAEMRLLPTPTLTFSDVRVGEPEDPLLAVSRFAVRIELPPLLKGEVRIIDMTLDEPSLRLSLDEQGRLDWFTGLNRDGFLRDVDPDLVMLERATIRDGRLSVVDARSGRSHSLDDIDLLVGARSLLGPYKLDGMVSHNGQRATVVLATGRRDAEGALRLRAGITPVSVPVDLVMDGQVSLAEGKPAYEGGYTLNSVVTEEGAATGWVSEGAFALDVARLGLTDASLRYGPEDRPVTIEGGLDVAFSNPSRFDFTGTAKQIDLDRIAGRGPQEPLSPGEAGGLLLSALQGLPHPPIDGRIALDVPAVVAGGGLVQDVRIEAERLASGWRLAEISGQMPGRSPFLARGDLELKPRAAFRGSFAASVSQPNVFADWWRQGVVVDAVVDPFALESRIEASPAGLALTDLVFELAGEQGRGAVSYRAPPAGAPVFEADLDADLLDADQAALLARLFLGGENGIFARPGETATQVALRLYAQKLKVRDLTASSIALRASYEGDILEIEDLTVADLAGAKLAANGRITDVSTAPAGAMQLKVDADRLGGVATLLETLFPNAEALALFTDRPELFAPARLDVAFQGEAAGGNALAGTQATVTLSGTAGGTEVDVSLGLRGRLDAWREATLDFEAGFTAADGGDLLRQLGLTVLPVAQLGEARVELGGAGVPQQGLDGHARLYLDEASLVGVGTLSLPEDGPSSYSADLGAKASDLLPLTLITGRLPSLSSSVGDVDLVATLEGEGDEFSLSGLSGRIAGTEVDADLQIDLRRSVASLQPQVRGSAALSDLDPAALGDLLLGADQLTAARDGAGWPSIAFGPPVVSGVDVALDVTARRLPLGPSLEASDMTGTLGLKDDALSLDVDGADLAGGRLTGALSVKRTDGQAGLTLSMRVENGALGDFIWRRNARPVATGRMDLSLDLEGTGRSLAGIVSGLAGGATLSIRDGEIRGINPEAFGLVIRAADAGLELDDAAVRSAFESYLDAGRLPFEALEAGATVAGGVVRVSNVTLDNTSATVFGNARIDLDAQTLDSDFSLKVDPGAEAVTGAEPEVGLVFSGALGDPGRSIDIAPFTAFLTLRAFEREVQRIEELQAEIDAREQAMEERMQLLQQEKRREDAKTRLPGDPEPEAPQPEEEEEAAASSPMPAIDVPSTPGVATPNAPQAPVVATPAAPSAPAVPRRRETLPASQPSQAANPAAESGFRDRIRSALEQIDATGRIAPSEPEPGEPMRLLPPLDPPVFIDVTPDR